MLIARDLIPKLQTALTTGNESVHVVLRMSKRSNPETTAQNVLGPMYGDTGIYTVINHGDSDPLGNIIKIDESAVRATFDLNSAIAHLQTLDPTTRIRT